MTRLLYGLGRFCVRHRWLVSGIWLAVVLVVGYLARDLGSRTNDNYTLPGTGAQRASDLLERLFPEQRNGSSPIVFHTAEGTLTDDAHGQAMQDAFEAVKTAPHVQDAINPLGKAGKFIGLMSNDETAAYIPVIMDEESGDISISQAESVVEAARAPAEQAGIRVAAGGILGAIISQPDPGGADIYGLAAAMVILLLVFGSVVAMGLPIATALFGLSIGLGSITILSHSIDIPTEAPTLATMIGLGVGIDYALFTVTRHRDQMRDGMDVKESIARATATSGGAIVFAGGTVMIAIASLGLAGIPLVVTLGYTTSIVVAVAVLAAITLMPALLAIVGRRVDSLRMPKFLRPRNKDPRTGVWAKWADWVGKHPWPSVGMAFLILAPLTLPVFQLELGSPDVASDPKGTLQRQAYELMSHGFGPGYNGPLLVAVELDTPAEASPQFLAERDHAKDIGRQLKGFQAYGEHTKSTLTSKGNQLKSEGLALVAQGAPLQTAQAKLQKEGAALLRQTEILKRKGAALLRKKTVLERRGAALEQRGAALGALLTGILTNEQIVAQKIASTTDPAKLARLQARLQHLQAKQAVVERKLAGVKAAGERLQAQGARLAQQGAELEAQGTKLAEQAAALKASGLELAALGAPLLEKKTQLEQAGAKLKRQAHRAKVHGRVLKHRAKAKIDRVKELKKSLVQQMKDAAGKQRATDPRLTALRDALEATPGVVDVSPIQISDSGRAAVISAVPGTSPSSAETSSLVARIRQEVIPAATHGNGVKAYVGGMTAAYDDLATTIAEKLPLVIATVIGLSFLLLLLAFRSIAIPIKAAIVNILSVTAAYGVLTAVFQWGWGLRLIGIQDAAHVPIVSFVPLMMFAVLFGLSMDYEVFLMSQIVEHHAVGDSDHDAVVAGLSLSARVITAAALIMVAVFASFILNENPIIKQFGVGLSVAVALDATIIRILLVPATMTLLGSANWWLPKWLNKILPRVELEGKGYFKRREETAREQEAQPVGVD